MNFENNTPEWTKEGTEPSDEIKNKGFAPGYKPPATFFNWFWNSVSKNLAEIKNKLSNVDNTADADKTVKRAGTAGTADKTAKKLTVQLNGGTTEGTDKFTFDGSAEKSVNVTKDKIGLGNVDNTADSTKSVSFASTAGSANKTKSAMTVRLNGGSTEGQDKYTFDGSAAKSVNITPASIGAASTSNGAVVSSGSDYAICFQWSDGNTKKENRTNRFVQLTDGGSKISLATSNADICGVTTDNAGFIENHDIASDYTSFVGVLGIVTVIDNGTCTVGETCMSDDSGYATPSSNNMGYRVMERVDDSKIKIAVKPNDDMIQRIKTDVATLNSGLATKANANHNHDDRYYTESEMNMKLAGKSDTGHSHAWGAITDKPSTFAPASHNHDDRYYTESEMDDKLAGKQNIVNRTVGGNIDWNTLITAGAYKIQACSMTGELHAPVGEYQYGILEVVDSELSTGEHRVLQIYWPHQPNSGAIFWYRMHNSADYSNGWRAWAKVAVKPATAGTADKANSVAWGSVTGKPTLGNASGKNTRSLSTQGHSGWANQSTDDGYVPTMAFMAFWNGAYASSGASNLLYCDRGRFGTIVTKGSGDYAAAGHTHNLSTLINALSEGTSTPEDKDYYVSQYVGGGTSTTTYHRRPMSALWAYIKGKADSIYQAKGSYSASNHTHKSVIDNNNGSSATTFCYSKAGMNYADYTWLAAWNGYELRAVNKSQFAQASHSHSAGTTGAFSGVSASGSNYVRFTDGTQICWGSRMCPGSSAVGYTLPVAFSTSYPIQIASHDNTNIMGGNNTKLNVTGEGKVLAISGGQTSETIQFILIGRWK